MDALTREPVIAPPKGHVSRGRVRRWGIALLAAAVTAVAGAGIWYWPVTVPEKKAARFREGAQVIPVVEALAVRRDMAVWLDGLGTVQAFQTVTVKSMIDGPLIAVEFKEGQEIKAGEVMARVDQRIYQASVDNAVAKKALDEAALTNARLDLARYQKLVATSFATQQQADTSRAQVAQLEAQVRQDQAQIDTAKTQLSYATVIAPISGRIGMRLVDMGNLVRAGDATGLAVITQLQPISVLFSLPQQNLGPVVAAMAAKTPVPVMAWPQGAMGGVTPLDSGVLAVLDNQIDPATGTIKMKATFPNAGRTLWPGGFVGVRLRVDTVKDAVVVPAAAVQRGPRESFVYLIDGENVARRTNVTVGYEDDQGTVVTSGVTPGDRVVVDGVSRLTDGAKVAVVSPDADKAPPKAGDRPAAPGTLRRDRPGG